LYIAVLHCATVYKVSPSLAVASRRDISAFVVRSWKAELARNAKKFKLSSVYTNGPLLPAKPEKRRRIIGTGQAEI